MIAIVKKKKKEKEENINEKENENENINKLKEISINLSVGKNFSFGIKDILSNKSFGNQSSGEILNSFDDSNKFKGYKNFKIVKNNFELRQKYKKDVYTKKYGFSRQKEKLADNKKEIIQDKVIEINSQIPSLAKIINLSSYKNEYSVISGSEITPTLCAIPSPKLLLIANPGTSSSFNQTLFGPI